MDHNRLGVLAGLPGQERAGCDFYSSRPEYGSHPTFDCGTFVSRIDLLLLYIPCTWVCTPPLDCIFGASSLPCSTDGLRKAPNQEGSHPSQGRGTDPS